MRFVRPFRYSLAALLPMMFSASASIGQDIAALVADADQAMGRIVVSGDGESWTGSGFVFAEDASGRPILLTNSHVAGEGGEITVFFLGGPDKIVPFSGTVVASSADMDMAALVLTQQEGTPFRPKQVPLAVRSLDKGEAIIALGYPGASDQVLGSDLNLALFETTLTQGLVSKVFVAPWPKDDGSTLGEPIEMVQHTAAINHGNSGGPLLDDCGQVVGMNTYGYVDDNIFLASSSRSIADFLDAAGIAFVGTTQKCGAVAGIVPTQTPGQAVPVWLPILGVLVGVAALVGIVAVAVGTGSKEGSPDPFATQLASAVTILIRAESKGGVVMSRSLPMQALSRGVIVGSSAEADVQIDVPGISRQHLRLELVQRQLMVTDLGSTNGTAIDGKALKAGHKRQINSRSRISLASVAEITLGRG